MRYLFLSAAIAATASASVFAQKPEAAGAMAVQTVPGKGVVTNLVKMTASVEAIDAASRTVTLKGPGGNLVPIVAGPEVKNFDQIKVGDRVLVRYAEALSLELKKNGKEWRQRSEREASQGAPAGERPAGAAGRQIKVIADVTAVDRKKQMITLRGPKQTVNLKLRDPEQVKLVKVGDQVEATYQEAMAVSVDPAPKAKAAVTK